MASNPRGMEHPGPAATTATSQGGVHGSGSEETSREIRECERVERAKICDVSMARRWLRLHFDWWHWLGLLAWGAIWKRKICAIIYCLSGFKIDFQAYHFGILASN